VRAGGGKQCPDWTSTLRGACRASFSTRSAHVDLRLTSRGVEAAAGVQGSGVKGAWQVARTHGMNSSRVLLVATGGAGPAGRPPSTSIADGPATSTIRLVLAAGGTVAGGTAAARVGRMCSRRIMLTIR